MQPVTLVFSEWQCLSGLHTCQALLPERGFLCCFLKCRRALPRAPARRPKSLSSTSCCTPLPWELEDFMVCLVCHVRPENWDEQKLCSLCRRNPETAGTLSAFGLLSTRCRPKEIARQSLSKSFCREVVVYSPIPPMKLTCNLAFA